MFTRKSSNTAHSVHTIFNTGFATASVCTDLFFFTNKKTHAGIIHAACIARVRKKWSNEFRVDIIIKIDSEGLKSVERLGLVFLYVCVCMREYWRRWGCGICCVRLMLLFIEYLCRRRLLPLVRCLLEFFSFFFSEPRYAVASTRFCGIARGRRKRVDDIISRRNSL